MLRRGTGLATTPSDNTDEAGAGFRQAGPPDHGDCSTTPAGASGSVLALLLGVFFLATPMAATGEPAPPNMSHEDFMALIGKRAGEARLAREASPFQQLSADYFARFSRDPGTVATAGEVAVTPVWRIVHGEEAPVVVGKMAGHLADFLNRCMLLPVPVVTVTGPGSIVLIESGGGVEGVPESFTIRATPDRIEVLGVDAAGLRSGVVRLIGMMGLRQAPFATIGETVFTPRIASRRGALGGIPNDIFYGCNEVSIGSADLYAMSTSDAIPELAARRNPAVLEGLVAAAENVRAYDMRITVHLSTVHKFAKDDPIFTTHPEIRGALTWIENGDYTLCTEHPLVRQYLEESVEGLFRAIPDLDGITIIIGGEGFYHCFMRAYGVERGHTNCARCEPLGAERAVANLCNYIAAAARRVNPEAQVIAWPYSAAAVWSADYAQEGLMRLLGPGITILTEPEKDETVRKPGGIEKRLWDYSIDMTDLGSRAARQIAVSRETGVPVQVLTMAEMSFEASLLPMVPVHDRWAARADTLASCGASGVYLWNMAPFDGLSSGEIYQHKWFDPAPDTDDLLTALATRICGNREAGDHLRRAWREVSNGFTYTPALGSYYKGPNYLGPAHPVVLDPDTPIPDVFKGYYLFLMEITTESGMEPMPTYLLRPEEIEGYFGPESTPVIETYHRVFEDHLHRAVEAVEKADPLVPDRCRMVFDAETLPVRWYYHTVRTQANLFEVFRLTARLREMISRENPPEAASAEVARKAVARLREVLLDEQANVREALPVAQNDPRIGTIHRGDHSFSHLTDMLAAKITLLDREIGESLSALEAQVENRISTGTEPVS